MSGLKERLERLRAAAASASPATEREQPAGGSPDAGVAAVHGGDVPGAPDLHAGFRSFGVEMSENEWGSFLLRRCVYDFPHHHGRYNLEELLRCASLLLPVAQRQNGESEDVDARRLLFLDTETTGLGVGAGNVPFMIGFGYYTERSFVVEQTLIRHPGEEKAMLAYLLGHLKDKTHLVTYNGRTFDWPVLVNRYIMNGWRKNGVEPGHLDFLHPSRALWRNTLSSCRLGTVEEQRLGVRRDNDVPGSLAPALYMQYLNEGDPLVLQGVYNHNEQDVLTLASLAVHFGKLLSEPPSGGHYDEAAGEELFRTACWLEKHGNAGHAEIMFERLAELGQDRAGEWSLALAARYKRAGRYDRALPLWLQTAVLEETSALPKVDAHIELAMYYEHREKELLMALNYARKALELHLRRPGSGRQAARSKEERAALQRRLDRLKLKLDRNRVFAAERGTTS